MLPLIGLAASFLPDLIRLIGDDKTASLATKVGQVVTDVVGTDDATAARAKLEDPAVATQLRTRLAEIAVEAQKVQTAAAAAQRQAELDQLKAVIGDVENARGTFLELANKESPVAWGAPVVSVIIAAGFFLILGLVVFGKELPDANKEVTYTLIGTLATGFATMISFWLGSSQGSRDKDLAARQQQFTHAQQTSALISKVQQPPPPPPAPAPVAAPPAPPPVAAPAVAPPQPIVVTMPPAEVAPARPKVANFQPCLKLVLDMEGSFSDDPRDPGGMTNLGITRAELADVRRVPISSITEADMKALTQEEAAGIYFNRYWNVLRCDDLGAGVDLMAFHFGVNAGTGTSAKLLQDAVGAKMDGIVGKQTVAATVNLDPHALVERLASKQLDHYQTLAGWPTFGKGWTNRVSKASTAALAMLP